MLVVVDPEAERLGNSPSTTISACSGQGEDCGTLLVSRQTKS